MQIVKKYERNKGKTFQRYVTFFLGGPFIIFGIIILTKNFLRISNESGFASAILTFVFLLFGIVALFGAILCFTETWNVASIVEITENEIIGYSQHGKNKWIMRLDEIQEITRPKPFKHFLIISAMVLKNKDGNYLFIGIDTQKFGECMEYIASKAVNAKKINFGSWQNDRFVWTK